MENTEGKTALGLDNNVGALVCYLGNLVCGLGYIYAIIVLVTDKTNKLPRFHAFQSLLTMGFSFLLGVGYMIVGVVGTVIDSAIGLPIVTLLGMFVMFLLGLGLFVMVIFAAVKAFQGELFKIPIIGGFADQWSD